VQLIDASYRLHHVYTRNTSTSTRQKHHSSLRYNAVEHIYTSLFFSPLLMANATRAARRLRSSPILHPNHTSELGARFLRPRVEPYVDLTSTSLASLHLSSSWLTRAGELPTAGSAHGGAGSSRRERGGPSPPAASSGSCASVAAPCAGDCPPAKGRGQQESRGARARRPRVGLIGYLGDESDDLFQLVHGAGHLQQASLG
jgi:hypothetical protein